MWQHSIQAGGRGERFFSFYSGAAKVCARHSSQSPGPSARVAEMGLASLTLLGGAPKAESAGSSEARLVAGGRALNLVSSPPCPVYQVKRRGRAGAGNMASGSFDVSPAPRASAAATSPAQNKPDNTAFTQQRLPAWQPLLSAGTVLPLFFCLGAAFLAIGLGMHFSSDQIQELELDYTGAPGSACARCANLSSRSPPQSCNCSLRFEVPHNFSSPVCLYYQLSNYYQNNRRYSISRDDSELSGDAWALQNPIDDCQPYQRIANGTAIAPCGSIANSLFNDTFALYRVLADNKMVQVPLDKRGISWWTDTNIKFRNPEPVNGSLARAFSHTVKPPNWPYPVYYLDDGNLNNTGFINEDFIVWMRTAALPTFRKLYARIHQGNFSVLLPRGNYSLNVTYNYPVLSFHGTKKVIFSTLSWMGGKNSFLGIAYLVFGSACILTGCIMLVVHFKFKDQNEADA